MRESSTGQRQPVAFAAGPFPSLPETPSGRLRPWASPPGSAGCWAEVDIPPLPQASQRWWVDVPTLIRAWRRAYVFRRPSRIPCCVSAPLAAFRASMSRRQAAIASEIAVGTPGDGGGRIGVAARVGDQPELTARAGLRAALPRRGPRGTLSFCRPSADGPAVREPRRPRYRVQGLSGKHLLDITSVAQRSGSGPQARASERGPREAHGTRGGATAAGGLRARPGCGPAGSNRPRPYNAG